MRTSTLRPPNIHILRDEIVTCEVQSRKPAKSVSSRSILKIKGKRKREDTTDSTSLKLLQLTNVGIDLSVLKELAESLVVDECVKRKQHREAQQRYREKQRALVTSLDKDAQDLHQQIKVLEERLCRATISFETSDGVWDTAMEYFRLVRCGPQVNEFGFGLSAMAPDVVFNDEYGLDAITRSLCLSKWFDDVKVDLKDVYTIDENSLVAITKTSVTITGQTLRNVFPHLRTIDNSDRNSELAEKLLGQRLTMRGSMCFEWACSTCRVTSDILTPMLRLLGNLEDVSRVFEKALISPDFNWRLTL